ncbi:MAG: phosphonoacetaldehyde hydrolase [Alphaproteobacteria bacterium]|nr:phosphonoacetaldehyde hydrolase [Alphaproteobacteria bacterium]
MNALKAVIFDWAGTLIDHGCLAPALAFTTVFERLGVPISAAEARIPMGLPKWEHILAVGKMPRVSSDWAKRYGHAFAEADADRVFAVFEPENIRIIKDHSAPIAGVANVLSALKERGLRMGSTTGYTRAIMEVVIPLAAGKGVAPEQVVCAGETQEGRPSPLMLWKNLVELGVWPADAAVKVDDTPVGIREGRNAGCWTIAVTETGNAMGLSEDELNALSADERTRRRQLIADELLEAGAHMTIPSVRELMPALDLIEAARAQGRKP